MKYLVVLNFCGFGQGLEEKNSLEEAEEYIQSLLANPRFHTWFAEEEYRAPERRDFTIEQTKRAN